MKREKMSRASMVVICILLVILLGVSLAFMFVVRSISGGGRPSGAASQAVSGGVPSSGAGEATGQYQPAALPQEMRAVWISYLEWESRDISTEQAMRSVAGEMFDNCVATGLNTVIVQVRPFGDALYRSSVYPWSHLLTGTQGQDPGYDPLAVMIEEAHARGLRLEAWLNPYRVRRHPEVVLSANNPATLHPQWVREVNGEQWYDPAIPEVQQMVVDGVREIAQYYDVDGIQFDDYFYQEGITEAFDAETYAQYGAGQPLADWRRENVNTLVRAIYAAIKEAKPTLAFGISPAGNNDNNYGKYYADIKLWMANPGYVDYIMPQIYWGFSWTSNGSNFAAFDIKCAEWAGYPRDASVQLYAGLAIYRIGELQPDGTRKNLGHGGDGVQTEWESGHNMADQLNHLRNTGSFTGFALYRYDFMYAPGDPLAQLEDEALKAALQE